MKLTLWGQLITLLTCIYLLFVDVRNASLRFDVFGVKGGRFVTAYQAIKSGQS